MRSPLAILLLVLLAFVPAGAAVADDSSENVSLVKNIPHPVKQQYGAKVPYGTDIDFAQIKGRRYALAGSELNGLMVLDVTNPAKTRTVTVYDCAISQGDPYVFTRKDLKGRTFVTYTADYDNFTDAKCAREAAALGFDMDDPDEDDPRVGKLGTYVIEITNPRRPRTVSFVAFPQGSHNMTVHPSGRYLYNSNSDLITSVALNGNPTIEVVDITDLRNPREAGSVTFTPRPGLGTESHDITFNDEGTRAYSAALSQGVILNTEDPANPSVITQFEDPAINVWHQADPFSIGDRDFLIVEDEVAGAAGGNVCPTGGVHIYDVTGANEQRPRKVGYWNIDDFRTTRDPLDTCTAHVFDIHEKEQVMTIAFYMGGVRVVDLSGLGDLNVSLGERNPAGGMKQVGYYVTGNANTWAVKTPYIEPDGDFYMYGNDINRGVDVYRYEAQAPESAETGTWMSAAQARTRLPDLKAGSLSTDKRVFCLIGR